MTEVGVGRVFWRGGGHACALTLKNYDPLNAVYGTTDVLLAAK